MDDEAPDIPREWEIDGINIFKMTLSTEIAQQNLRTGGMDLVPTPYKDFAHVFNEDASKRLPKRRLLRTYFLFFLFLTYKCIVATNATTLGLTVSLLTRFLPFLQYTLL